MKVLLINGSPRSKGNTYIALCEVAKALEGNGIDTEIVSIGTKAIQGCIACNRCTELGHCVFNDALYHSIRTKLETADGIVIGSPVYYAGPNGSLCALLDRLFYSASPLLQYKPAASVAVCRRVAYRHLAVSGYREKPVLIDAGDRFVRTRPGAAQVRRI